MSNYERWKYCNHIKNRSKCGAVADYECTNSKCYHRDDLQGMANPSKKSEIADHPRFLCSHHVELYDK